MVMRKMLKVTALVGAMVMAMMSFVGCSKETECGMCKQVKDCEEYEVDGEDVYLCETCGALVEAAQAAQDLLK